MKEKLTYVERNGQRNGDQPRESYQRIVWTKITLGAVP